MNARSGARIVRESCSSSASFDRADGHRGEPASVSSSLVIREGSATGEDSCDSLAVEVESPRSFQLSLLVVRLAWVGRIRGRVVVWFACHLASISKNRDRHGAENVLFAP